MENGQGGEHEEQDPPIRLEQEDGEEEINRNGIAIPNPIGQGAAAFNAANLDGEQVDDEDARGDRHEAGVAENQGQEDEEDQQNLQNQDNEGDENVIQR